MAKTSYRYDMSTAQVPRIDREAYAAAAPFLARLKVYRDDPSWKQWHDLRGQALAGDIEGAEKGLERIMRRNTEEAKKRENGIA